MIYFPYKLGDCLVLKKKFNAYTKQAIIGYTNCFSQDLDFKTKQESVSWRAIDSHSLRALPQSESTAAVC